MDQTDYHSDEKRGLQWPLYPFSQGQSGNGRRVASILIVVLWLIFLLGALTLGLRARVSGRIRVAERVQRQTWAMAAARAGIAAAQAEIAQVGTNRWHALSDPWADDPTRFRAIPVPPGQFSLISPGEAETRYGLADETGKLNLNALPQTPEGFALLKELLLIMGPPDPGVAGNLAAAIFDWRDGSNGVYQVGSYAGAEADYYLNLPVPFRPHDDRLTSLEELLWVRGMSTGRFERLQTQVTIYGANAAININTAPREVLLALARSHGTPATAESLVRSIEQSRSGIPVFTNQAAILSVLQKDLEGPEWMLLNEIYPLLTVRSTHFRAISEGYALPTDTQATCRIEAVLDTQSRIVEWREE
jgi:type II secretory pathway component PulK